MRKKSVLEKQRVSWADNCGHSLFATRTFDCIPGERAKCVTQSFNDKTLRRQSTWARQAAMAQSDQSIRNRILQESQSDDFWRHNEFYSSEDEFEGRDEDDDLSDDVDSGASRAAEVLMHLAAPDVGAAEALLYIKMS